jgi:hypothetical protein
MTLAVAGNDHRAATIPIPTTATTLPLIDDRIYFSPFRFSAVFTAVTL